MVEGGFPADEVVVVIGEGSREAGFRRIEVMVMVAGRRRRGGGV